MQIILEETGGDDFLSMRRIPVQDTTDISLFNFGENDLIFCKMDSERSSVMLTTLYTEDPSLFTKTQFNIEGNLEIMEISESNTIDNPFLRMIGIRDREEVFCWEIKVSANGPKTQKIFNRTDRSNFRWPYYAHVMSDHEIVIKYLNQQDKGIYYKMPFEDE